MSGEYDPTNRGALWKNERREKDTHPNLTGQLNVEGREYWVNAWTSKEGGKKPVVSMSIKAKDTQTAPRPQNDPPPYDDSDLPF